ncbi:hypothetical protein Hamer_G031327, partial [Homarus americanus]
AAHVTRTRRGHLITAATLNILQHKAYGKYTEDAQSDGQEPLEFEMGNPFEEESADLMVLHTKEILCPEDVTSVQNVVKLGREQFHSYVRERLEDNLLTRSLTLHMSPQLYSMDLPLWKCRSQEAVGFQEYSTAVFIPYIESQLEYRSRLDLGIRRCVTASGPLPSNWQNFLCYSDNKEELFSFLSEQVMQLVVKESKQLVVTDKTQVLTVPPRKDTANLAPCNHEEADTRMMEYGNRRILIRTVDTDVDILAVALENERSEVLDELWLTFGTGKNRHCITAHQIAKALGPEKSRALPVFHAITGCDTVYASAGHSKKAAWATWNAFPEVTTAFLSLASTPSELPDGVLSTLERFIVLLYDRTSTCCDMNVLRKKLFSRKSRSLEDLLPTRAALEQHINRAAYQAGHI